jgi:hypothetical protein
LRPILGGGRDEVQRRFGCATHKMLIVTYSTPRAAQCLYDIGLDLAVDAPLSTVPLPYDMHHSKLVHSPRGFHHACGYAGARNRRTGACGM